MDTKCISHISVDATAGVTTKQTKMIEPSTQHKTLAGFSQYRMDVSASGPRTPPLTMPKMASTTVGPADMVTVAKKTDLK